MTDAIKEVAVERAGAHATHAMLDVLAVEQPLEIRVSWADEGGPRLATVAVTMRTPDNDCELAAGFLFTEGIVRRRDQIAGIRSCRPGSVRVELAPGTRVDLARLERHAYTTSSCGLCGKTSTSALRAVPSYWPIVFPPVSDYSS